MWLTKRICKRKTLVICIPLVVHAVLVIPYLSYTPDDTYIHLQFAKNLYTGQGFSFNAGEPTYGSTSPLWVILITTGRLFSDNYIVLSKGFGILFSFGTIVLFTVLANRFLGNLELTFACAFVWSVGSWFLRWTPSGMETSFALFLFLLGLLVYTRERTSLERVFFTPVVIALFTLVRPEAFLLFTILLFDFVVFVRAHPRKLVFFILTYLVVLAPWLIYAYHHFGTIVPNTFIAKGTPSLFNLENWFRSTVSVFKVVLSNRCWEILLVLAGAVLLVWRYGFSLEPYRKHSTWQFIATAWIILLPGAYIVKGLPIVSRYMILITPMLILLGFFSLSQICRYLPQAKRMKNGIVWTLVLFSMAQNMLVSWIVVYPHTRLFRKGMRECFIPIGKWFKEETPDHTTIAALDIGAIGYYSEKRILDLGGLVVPQIHSLLKQYSPEELADTYPTLNFSLPKANYIVYRAKVLNAVDPLREYYEPLFTKSVSSLGISADPGETYYTVCRIHWDRFNGKGQ